MVWARDGGGYGPVGVEMGSNGVGMGKGRHILGLLPEETVSPGMLRTNLCKTLSFSWPLKSVPAIGVYESRKK